MSFISVGMSVHRLCAQCRRSEASVGSSRAGATHGCEPYVGAGTKLKGSARAKMFFIMIIKPSLQYFVCMGILSTCKSIHQ